MLFINEKETFLMFVFPRMGGGWTGYDTIEGLGESVTAMCSVGDTVWLGDTQGCIHIYATSPPTRILSYK